MEKCECDYSFKIWIFYWFWSATYQLSNIGKDQVTIFKETEQLKLLTIKKIYVINIKYIYIAIKRITNG